MNKNKMYGLQIFADTVINTTGSNTSGNDLSPEMKDFYNTALIRMAEPELRYKKFAKKVPMPKNNGKTVSFRKWGSFAKATTPLTEGVTPAGSKLNVTEITATVSQYGAYTLVTDMLELTAVDPVIMEVTQLHGSQAAVTLDTICRNEVMTGTNVVYAPNGEAEVTSRSALTSACVLTPDIVAKVAAKLKANNAPKIDGCYIAIVHPYVAYDIRSSKGWIEVHQYNATREIFEGEIGELHGVRFVESSEAKIWDESGVAVFGTIFFGDGAYGDVDLDGGNLQIIVKQRGSAGTADPLNQRASVGWKATGVTKILIPEYLYRVESGSSFSGTAAAN